MAETVLELNDYRVLNGRQKQQTSERRVTCFKSCSTKCCFFCSGLLAGLLLAIVMLAILQNESTDRRGRAVKGFHVTQPSLTSSPVTPRFIFGTTFETNQTSSEVSTLLISTQMTVSEVTPGFVNEMTKNESTLGTISSTSGQILTTTQTSFETTLFRVIPQTTEETTETTALLTVSDVTTEQLLELTDRVIPEVTEVTTTLTTTQISKEISFNVNETQVTSQMRSEIENSTQTENRTQDITEETIVDNSENSTKEMTTRPVVNTTEVITTTEIVNRSENHVNNTTDSSLLTNNETFNSTANQTQELFNNQSLTQEVFCSSSQFSCPEDNQTCLSRDLLCDGITDCVSEWDESQCLTGCESNFRCNGSQCISRQNYCDGIFDCPDGEDEVGCHVSQCQKGELLCQDKSRCIKGKEACDHVSQCPDHSDEIGCVLPGECQSSGRFYCEENGLCIDGSLRCDQQKDCLNGSDEQNCENGITCSAKNGFLCENNECVSREKRCDSFADCSDKSDEFECLSLEKSSKIVFLFNSEKNFWNPFCLQKEFSKRDADLLCRKLGFWRSHNFSRVSLKPINGFWAQNQTSFLTECQTNESLSLLCEPQECGRGSEDSAPKALLITDSDGNECPALVLASHWLLMSTGCQKKLSQNLSEIEIRSHKREPIYVTIDYFMPHFRYSKFRSRRVPDFDVCLVRTRQVLPSEALCLPSHPIDPAITCFAVNSGEDLGFEVIESKVCNGSNHLAGSLTSRHFCATSGQKKCLPVGTPLTCLSSQSLWYISGFLSFQYGCTGSQFTGYSHVAHPALFSNVFSVEEWIRRAIGSQEISFEKQIYELLDKNNETLENSTSGSMNSTEMVSTLVEETTTSGLQNLTSGDFNGTSAEMTLNSIFETRVTEEEKEEKSNEKVTTEGLVSEEEVTKSLMSSSEAFNGRPSVENVTKSDELLPMNAN